MTVKLPVLGTYGATAPFACPKSKRIFEQGCAMLAKRVADPSYNPDAIVRSLNALALLASGKPEYPPIVSKEAQWAAGFSAESMATWYYGYVTLFLAKYKLATGDDSVMPGLKRLALEAANGQSMVGSWGHKFARPDGRLSGYGMMNSPGVLLTISLVMAAVLFNLLDESAGAGFFARMSLSSHGGERDCGQPQNSVFVFVFDNGAGKPDSRSRLRTAAGKPDSRSRLRTAAGKPASSQAVASHRTPRRWRATALLGEPNL